MTNPYVNKASDLVNTHESTRSGFLEYALRKSKEAIPYIDKAKALKMILEQRTKKPSDILKVDEIQDSCYEAAGVSVKANSYLTLEDRHDILVEFIKEFLEPAGAKYIDELIFRYLLTAGDALGGRMRNLVGAIANEKLTRSIISQLEVLGLPFKYFDKQSKSWIESENYSIDQVSDIRAIQWTLKSGQQRLLVYNLTVPMVKKNIDIVVLNSHTEELSGSSFKELIKEHSSYVMLGELKGGIDPAGADEHWKTANTALSRVRDGFKKARINIPLVFVGAAIETSMSKEIFAQYQSGKIENCANITVENQPLALCNWMVSK